MRVLLHYIFRRKAKVRHLHAAHRRPSFTISGKVTNPLPSMTPLSLPRMLICTRRGDEERTSCLQVPKRSPG